MDWLKVGKSFKPLKPEKEQKSKKTKEPEEAALFPVADLKRREKKHEQKIEAKFDL